MPKPIKTGSDQPILQRTRLSSDPSQGITTTKEYEGIGAESLDGLATSFGRVGWATDLTITGVKSRLVATSSRNTFVEETPVARWELTSNQDSLDIKEHPKSVAIGQAGIAAVLKQFRIHEAGRTATTSGFSANQLALFEHLKRGMHTYPVWRWVLRYTANVSNTYNVFTQANSGVGTILSRSQMAALIPGGRIRSTVEAISDQTGDAYTTWGWLKVALSEVQAARTRIDVSVEFILGAWSNYIYL